MMSNRILICAALAVAAFSAHADVTVTTDTAGKAAFINVDGEGVSQIKGTRMRTDSAFKGKTQTLIIDIDGRRFVDLDAKKKSAMVTPLETIADELQKVGVGTMQATLKKTAQTKQIAGFPCTVHDINLSLPFSPTGKPARAWTSPWCSPARCASAPALRDSRTTRSSTRPRRIPDSSSAIRARPSRPAARRRPRPTPR